MIKISLVSLLITVLAGAMLAIGITPVVDAYVQVVFTVSLVLFLLALIAAGFEKVN